MDNKISVIIPIYKVENYLNRCIESVVNQTYQNLEIILVDDGSPDNCPRMCDEWAKKDNRIKVIHKENGGLSDARNAGMKVVTGEYVAFVDSDDWLHKEMFDILLSIQKKNEADIVECKALPISEMVEDKSIDVERIELKLFDTKEAMSSLLRENPLKQTVWNKLYKREVVEGIDFAFRKVHEDEFWTYQVIDKAQRIVFADVEMYYYFQRLDSIMGQEFSLKRLDAVEGRFRRLELFKDKYPELVSEAKENLVFLIIYYGQQALKVNKGDKELYFEQAIKYITKIEFSKKEMKKISWIHKIWVLGVKKRLKLVCGFRNKIKLGLN